MINNKVYGLLGLSAKAGKIAFGTDSCLEMISKHKLKLVIVAEDSSERTINNFKEKWKDFFENSKFAEGDLLEGGIIKHFENIFTVSLLLNVADDVLKLVKSSLKSTPYL